MKLYNRLQILVYSFSITIRIPPVSHCVYESRTVYLIRRRQAQQGDEY